MKPWEWERSTTRRRSCESAVTETPSVLRPGSLPVALTLALACACHARQAPVTITPPSLQVAPASLATAAPPVESVHRSAVESRCLELTTRANALIDAAMRAHPGCESAVRERLRDSFARCDVAPGGAWATLVSSFDEAARDESECGLYGDWRLAFVTPEGRVIEAAADPRVRLLGPQRFTCSGAALSVGTAPFVERSDIDGDGRAELYIRVIEGSIDGGAHTQEQRQAVLTARGDALAEYAPASRLEIIEAMDVDHDGRLDFTVLSPYRWSAPNNCNPPESANVTHHLLPLLAHAQPDGRFSTTDAVAVEYARRSCPTPDGLPSDEALDAASNEDDFGALRIACARLWGQPPAEALRSFHCQRFRAPGDPQCSDPSYRFATLPRGTCPAFFDAWSRMAPPLTLR